MHLIASAISQKKKDKEFENLSNKISRLVNNNKINKGLSEVLTNVSQSPYCFVTFKSISRQRFGQNEEVFSHF